MSKKRIPTIHICLFTLVLFMATLNMVYGQSSFDLNGVNQTVKTQVSPLRDLGLTISVIAIIIGMVLVIISFVTSYNTAKPGLLALLGGIIVYTILKNISI